MTSESKTEDTKTAPIDGASDSPQEPKSIEETKSIQDDSKQESVEKDASDTPVVEEAKEAKAEDSSKPAQQTSSISDDLAALKTNKKNKKVLNPKDLIKTPNKHDVLLGRGKPVSWHFYLLRTPSQSLINLFLHIPFALSCYSFRTTMEIRPCSGL